MMLGIPRPRTRAQCQDGPRPCPWVACRHHLLLEVAAPPKTHLGWAAHDPGLMLAQATKPGRRPHLRSSAAAELVRMWMDDALELLWAMPDSCSLDVADRREGYRTRIGEVAAHLMRSSESTRQELRRAAIAASVAARKAAISLESLVAAEVVKYAEGLHSRRRRK